MNIIFDYDGTLHNSIKIYAPSFRLAYNHLVNSGYAKEKTWQDSEISKWLGFSSKDMWNSFMPDLPLEIKEECSNIIGTSMIEYLNDGKGELYPNSLDVLNELKESGNVLIFLSNCKINYMNMHRKLFNLENYFDDFYCTESFKFKPKFEIMNHIKEKYKGEFIVIGDRYQDIEIAKVHNLFSIGCSYGYGSMNELSEANVVVNDIVDIVKIIKEKSKYK